MSAMKYQRDFLRFNKISQIAFCRIYVAFLKTSPTEADYRRFAGKYSIAILEDPYLPTDLRASLSVNLNAIKVMAASEEEARAAYQEVLAPLGLSGKADD
jgi:hypothetical protein